MVVTAQPTLTPGKFAWEGCVKVVTRQLLHVLITVRPMNTAITLSTLVETLRQIQIIAVMPIDSGSCPKHYSSDIHQCNSNVHRIVFFPSSSLAAFQSVCTFPMYLLYRIHSPKLSLPPPPPPPTFLLLSLFSLLYTNVFGFSDAHSFFLHLPCLFYFCFSYDLLNCRWGIGDCDKTCPFKSNGKQLKCKQAKCESCEKGLTTCEADFHSFKCVNLTSDRDHCGTYTCACFLFFSFSTFNS